VWGLSHQQEVDPNCRPLPLQVNNTLFFISCKKQLEIGNPKLLKTWRLFRHNSVMVRMGTLNFNLAVEPNRVTMNTNILVVHNLYNDTSKFNDVALVKLPSDAPINGRTFLLISDKMRALATILIKLAV
jgi:hypothetical protein